MAEGTQDTFSDIEAEAKRRYDIPADEFVGDEYDSEHLSAQSGFVEGAKWERNRASSASDHRLCGGEDCGEADGAWHHDEETCPNRKRTEATLEEATGTLFILNEQTADHVCACATCSYMRWIREHKPWLITAKIIERRGIRLGDDETP